MKKLFSFLIGEQSCSAIFLNSRLFLFGSAGLSQIIIIFIDKSWPQSDFSCDEFRERMTILFF
jgi:hypothetical protein